MPLEDSGMLLAPPADRFVRTSARAEKEDEFEWACRGLVPRPKTLKSSTKASALPPPPPAAGRWKEVMVVKVQTVLSPKRGGRPDRLLRTTSPTSPVETPISQRNHHALLRSKRVRISRVPSLPELCPPNSSRLKALTSCGPNAKSWPDLQSGLIEDKRQRSDSEELCAARDASAANTPHGECHSKVTWSIECADPIHRSQVQHALCRSSRMCSASLLPALAAWGSPDTVYSAAGTTRSLSSSASSDASDTGSSMSSGSRTGGAHPQYKQSHIRPPRHIGRIFQSSLVDREKENHE
jgi:hypothetical protein